MHHSICDGFSVNLLRGDQSLIVLSLSDLRVRDLRQCVWILFAFGRWLQAVLALVMNNMEISH